jgi:radical SAM superfamily enzyme YgiQ (UPF0313 family)
MSQLALAGPLLQAGYDVRILDVRWDHDWRDQLQEMSDRMVCFGIGSLTGPAVADGLLAADHLRRIRPDVPIVWGGWHATYAAEQAVHDPRVDVVVRGPGERTFVELLAALRENRPLSEVAGVTFLDGNRVVATPDRPTEDMNQFPPPAYHLVRAERYVSTLSRNVRLAGGIYSRGCPYFCNFCLDSRSKYLPLSVDRMIADVEFWLARGANHLRVYDGNFFLGRQRIVEVCEAILANSLEKRFRWSATGVGHRMARLEDDILALLAGAGLDQVALGAESGSDELLGGITNKTNVADTMESVRRLARHGIGAYLFFVVGYPDEPPDALDRTFDLVLALKRLNPDVEFHLNFTTPLPGSEVYRFAVERGLVKAPDTFADWARFDYKHPNLTMPADYATRVRRFSRYVHLAFGTRGGRRGLREAVRAPIRRAAHWRLSHRNFRWPVELAVQDMIALAG